MKKKAKVGDRTSPPKPRKKSEPGMYTVLESSDGPPWLVATMPSAFGIFQPIAGSLNAPDETDLP